MLINEGKNFSPGKLDDKANLTRLQTLLELLESNELFVFVAAAEADEDDDDEVDEVVLFPRRLATAEKLSKRLTVESFTFELIDRLGTETLIVLG